MRAVLCRTAYSVYPLGIFCSGSVSEPVACSGGGMHGCRAAAADDVSVCHVLAAGAVALFLLALVVLVGLLGIIAVVTAAVQLFLQNSYFRLRYWVFFLWGHICLPMCRWEMCGILSGNSLIPQYCMQPAEAGLWKMICACRLQEMNLPCYSAVERLRSA